MPSLVLENLPPGAVAVLCDNLRLTPKNGIKVPLSVRSVTIPSKGVIQITGLLDSNYSLLFTGIRNVQHSLFSIDVGDHSKFPGIVTKSSGSVTDEDLLEGARRALIGLNVYGLVKRNVPIDMASANIHGINSNGLLVPGQVQGSGENPETLFHTGNKPAISDVNGLQQALEDRVTDLELDDTVSAKVEKYLAGKETTVEDLSKQLDGKETTYTLTEPYITIKVFLNGLQQFEGADNDFIAPESYPMQTITFNRALMPYNRLLVEYTTT